MIGKRLVHYEVTALLGKGGMGEVYQATDLSLDRQVALKILSEDLVADPERVARFEREAKVLASLNHPGIAAIHGFHEQDGVRFLAMELVPGLDLADRLAQGPLSVEIALVVVKRIAEAIAYAHERGIVHRDLKPANIKIAADNKVKVLDFGLARVDLPRAASGPTDETVIQATAGHSTLAGTLLGTLPYMSPEQARGEAVDKRSDIWALGVILYECLSGVNPFARASGGETIAAILTTTPDLEALPRTVPALARTLLERCLRPNPGDRIRDAGDLELLLEDCRVTRPAARGVSIGAPAIVDKTFRIDDKVCQSLDRSAFDPRLIGWQMQYADNECSSEVLEVWVPSFGEDHAMGVWRDLLAATRHRAIVATPIGLEPGVTHRPTISLTNQLAVLRRLVTSVSAQMRPDRVVVGGFS